MEKRSCLGNSFKFKNCDKRNLYISDQMLALSSGHSIKIKILITTAKRLVGSGFCRKPALRKVVTSIKLPDFFLPLSLLTLCGSELSRPACAMLHKLIFINKAVSRSERDTPMVSVATAVHRSCTTLSLILLYYLLFLSQHMQIWTP